MLAWLSEATYSVQTGPSLAQIAQFFEQVGRNFFASAS
jgi:hypothetical protein